MNPWAGFCIPLLIIVTSYWGLTATIQKHQSEVKTQSHWKTQEQEFTNKKIHKTFSVIAGNGSVYDPYWSILPALLLFSGKGFCTKCFLLDRSLIVICSTAEFSLQHNT